MNSQAFVRLDPDFQIADWQAERIYGYQSRETVGRAGQDVLPALLGDRASRIAALEQDGAWTGLEAHRHKNGRLLLVEYMVRELRKRGQLAGYMALHRPLAQGDYKSLTDWRKSLQIARPPVTDFLTVARTATYENAISVETLATVKRAALNVASSDKQLEDHLIQLLSRNITLARELAQPRRPQQWLADQLGVDRTAVVHWENGRPPRRLKTIMRVAMALEQPLAFFFAEHPPTHDDGKASA